MIGGFSNANGVTFATNIAGRIEASIVTNYLPLGNSTQFAGAVHTHDYAASDHSHSQYLTTAAQSDHTHSQYLNTSQSSLLQHTSATSAITANAMNTSERGNYFYTSNNTFANQTHTHGAVAFSGTNASASFTSASNGLSIQLSAAAAGGAGDGYNILAAGGSTANTTGTVVFSNSNGVSFGLNGATMTASHNGLTTARASNDAIGLNTALTGNGVSVTANSSGLSINVPAFLTTAAQSGHSHGVTLNLTNINGTTGGNSNGINLSLSAVVPAQTVQPVAYSAANGSANFSTLAFANSQGVSFSTGTQGLYATVKTDYLTTARASTDAIGLNSALTANGVSMTANSSGLSLNFPAFLTTAAQSNHSHGNPSLNLTNLSGTTASNSAGFTLSLSAANPGGGGGAALSAGTQSVSTGTVAFANSNGISFGMSGSNQITASHNGLTTARASNDAVGLNTALTANGVSWTVNSSGLSLNVPAFLTTAMQSGASANFAATGFTTTSAAGAVIAGTHDTAGLKLAVPAFLTTAQAPGAYLTTARASNDAIGLNSAITQNGVSMTANSSGLSLNFPAFLTTAAQSGHSHGNPTLALTNLSGTTASASNGLTLSLSAAAPGAAAEANWMTLGGNVLGNSSASGSTIQIIGGNNITLSGLNNSQIRIDGAGGGGAGYTALSIQNRQLGASTTLNSGGGQNSLWLSPLRVVAAVSASTILAEMISYSGTITSAATAQAGQTIRAGIWSQLTDPASTTRFDTWWTGAASLTFWNSGTSSVSYAYSQSGGQTTGSSAGSNLMTASVMGARRIIFPIDSTMPTGLYVVGVLNSSSSAGYSAAMSRMAAYFDNPLSVGQGTFGQATNNSIGYADGGTYRTTTGGLPDTLALTQIGGVANVMPFFKIGAI